MRSVVDAGSTSFTDASLRNGIRYFYAVQAIDRATTKSAASLEASAVARKK